MRRELQSARHLMKEICNKAEWEIGAGIFFMYDTDKKEEDDNE